MRVVALLVLAVMALSMSLVVVAADDLEVIGPSSFPLSLGIAWNTSLI